VAIRGVEYVRLGTADGGDLYLTQYGVPFASQLHPENWLEEPWFSEHRHKLPGTSTIYRVPSKPVHGRSIPLVVRYNRMGQDLVMDDHMLAHFPNAEFQSPFEEFATLMELRSARNGPAGLRIHTKRPLAIYVSGRRIAWWQSGRREHVMAAIQERRAPRAIPGGRGGLCIRPVGRQGFSSGGHEASARDRAGG
jgi:hypothetical protein